MRWLLGCSLLDWNKNLISSALKDCNDAYAPLLSKLKVLLNKYHGIHWTNEQYNALLGNWLGRYLHVTYSHWLSVLDGENVIKKNTVLNKRPAKDITEFTSWVIYDSSYHLLIRYQILSLINSSFVNDLTTDRDEVVITNNLTLNHHIKRIYFKIINSPPSSSPKVLVCEPYIRYLGTIDHLLLFWKLRRICRFDNLLRPFQIKIKIDTAWRYSNVDAINKTSSFLDVASRLLQIHLPLIFLEGFSALKHHVAKLPLRTTKACYSGIALDSNMQFKMFVAKNYNDLTILSQQNGGNYGVDSYNTDEEYEKSVADIFYTWGWSDGRDSNTRYLPIREFPITNSLNNKDVLLVLANYPKHIYQIQFMPSAGNTQNMIDQTIEFVSRVHSFCNLTIRPYHYDYGQDFIGQIKRQAPGTYQIDKRKTTVYKQLSKYNLIVCNSVSTTWLETMSSNKPTVCFIDEEVISFRKQARPYIHELKQVGILHNNPASAAAHVKKICPNINSWWMQFDVQKARKKFIKEYVRTSKNWIKDWENEFRRVLKTTNLT
jgi:putative transferase (TIGR04331 family)